MKHAIDGTFRRWFDRLGNEPVQITDAYGNILGTWVPAGSPPPMHPPEPPTAAAGVVSPPKPGMGGPGAAAVPEESEYLTEHWTEEPPYLFRAHGTMTQYSADGGTTWQTFWSKRPPEGVRNMTLKMANEVDAFLRARSQRQ